MTSDWTLPLVDAIAAGATDIGLATPSEALRAQAALVRALVDQLGHYHPSERRVAVLHAQLGDELARLTELAPRAATPEEPVDSDEPLDVLVVEDEAPALQAMAILVHDLGYSCRATSSAEAALGEPEQRPAAIVISDWHLPGMSGLDLCRALKRRAPHTYFILVTAFHDEAGVMEGIRRGVDDLLPKPIDVDELAGRLDAGARLVRAVRTLDHVKQRMRGRSGPPAAEQGPAIL